MTRSLLLKGLAGVSALGGTVGGLVVFREEIFGIGKKKEEEPKSEDVSGFSQKELIEKVGLECGLTGDELTDNTPKDCNVKNNGTIKVKVRDKEEEGVTFSNSGNQKLKVSKSEEKGTDGTDKYTKKLKFVVDSGDLTLTKKDGAATPSTIQKLEQFETYEVFLRDSKFFLFRKTDAKEEKIKALGLPTGKGKCSLPETGSSECSLTTQEEIKKIKFENQTGGVTVTGTVTLKISKIEDKTSFPDGYRFTFTFPQDVSINGKNLKARIPYDFKIKKQADSNILSLERAWSEDKDFTKKAGLECTGNTNECSIPSGSNLKVKVGDKTKEGITTISTGKIKMETEKEGYNQGLKFTITTADISLSSVTGEIQKLEELETYEITEEGGKYYLTRKNEAIKTIGDLLGLAEAGCSLSSNSCSLSNEQIKNINFDGKEATSGITMNSGTATLTIAKSDKKEDFPLGYKFTFNTTADVTIKTNTTSIKARVPTEFKIKKAESGQTPTLSLEKAWTAESLGKKVGLTCNNSATNGCTMASGGSQLNIKKDADTKTGITSFSGSNSGSGKIKVEKDQEGYNHGLKFYIDGGDVTLTGGSETKGEKSGENLSILEEYETYEIMEDSGKWYLARKHESIVFLKKQLGLDFCNKTGWTRYAPSNSGPNDITFGCTTTDVDHLKKIKIHNKNGDHSWPTGKIEVRLEMKRKKTSNTNNYGEIELTISDNGSEAPKVCIPDGAGGTIDLKASGNSAGAAYKIKKSGSGSNITLCLEKKSGGSGGTCK